MREGTPGGSPRRWAAPASIALLAFLAYANSFPGAYIADDLPIVARSRLVRELDVRAIFAADYWGEGAGSGLYRPLTILSYGLNWRAFGDSAPGFHFVNVVLHAGVSVAAWSFLGALGIAPGLAWGAAALFAVHPIHTEVVNIVTGRAELLAALFVLLGLRSALLRGPWRTVVAGQFLVAGLLSKESAATMLPLLFAADAWIRGSVREAVRERWRLYFGLGVVVAIWLAYRRWGLLSGALPRNLHYALDNPIVEFGLDGRVLTVLKVQALYLGRILFPWHLDAIFVDTMIGAVPRLAGPAGVATGILGAGAVGALVVGWARRQTWALGLALHVLAFAVTANLLVLTTFLMAERFAYLPSVGSCLALAAALGGGAARLRGAGRAGAAAVAVAVVLMAGRTLVRNRDFRDGVTLWSADAGRVPGNVRAWILLAGAAGEAGNTSLAEEALRRAVAARPEFPEVHLSRGFLLLGLGRPAEAVEPFGRVLELVPGTSPLAMTGLAQAFLDLGMPAEAGYWAERVPTYFRHQPSYRDLATRIATSGAARGASPE